MGVLIEAEMTEPIALPTSLVVGIDYGGTGERALDYALGLAASHPETSLHAASVCLGSGARGRLCTPE